MKIKRGIVIIALFLSLFTLFSLLPSEVIGSSDDTTIHIRTLPDNHFSFSHMNLKPDTTYAVYFWNEVSLHFHNLVVATDGRTINQETAVLGPISNDVVIGKTDLTQVTEEDMGSPDDGFVGVTSWTTPDRDLFVNFFCSCPGHFDAGMRGYFKVGNPIGPPPFDGTPTLSELVFGFTFVLAVITALPIIAAAIAIPLDRKSTSNSV